MNANVLAEKYSFNAFVERVKSLHYEEILFEAAKACNEAEAASFGYRGCVAHRNAGSTKFAARLKAFLFFMQYFSIPSGHAGDLLSYRKIVDNLVKSGEFKEDALRRFDALRKKS